MPKTLYSPLLTGVNYHEVEFDLMVEEETLRINFTTVGSPVVVFSDDNILEVGTIQVVTLARSQFYLTPLDSEYLRRCPVPDNIIGQ